MQKSRWKKENNGAKMNKLYYCNHCKENSVKRKVYVRKKDNKKCRVEFCLNKGCGYRKRLPFMK